MVRIVSTVIRSNRRFATALLMGVMSTGIVACRDVRQPPPNVLVPEVVGHWRSETTDVNGALMMTLDRGQTIPVPDSSRDRIVLANPGPRTTDTLVMYGHEPNGRQWFVDLNPDPNFSLPNGAGPCYGAPTVGAYDEGATIVIQAPTESSGASFDFGIRLSKAQGMATPFPDVAPWYGPRFGVCLDSLGRVATGAY
jgi:hypothetical protein